MRCTSRGSGWRLKASVNGVSAVVTAMVALFAAVTNIMNPALPIVLGLPIGWGSWVMLLIVPLFTWLFRKFSHALPGG